jgi:ribosomal protein S27E
MLHALFKTFGELAAHGLEVEVRCPGCYRVAKIDRADDRLHDRPFAGARFNCTGMRDFGSAHLPRPSLQLGHIHIRQPDTTRIRPDQAIPWCSIACPRCVPCWEIDQAPRDQPPWQAIWAHPGARLACPTCRSVLTRSWSGGDGIPRHGRLSAVGHGGSTIRFATTIEGKKINTRQRRPLLFCGTSARAFRRISRRA